MKDLCALGSGQSWGVLNQYLSLSTLLRLVYVILNPEPKAKDQIGLLAEKGGCFSVKSVYVLANG